MDEAKETVVSAVQWSVMNGFGVHFMLDFWTYKKSQLLGILVSCAVQGVHLKKETFVAGIYNVTGMSHTANLVQELTEKTFAFLTIEVKNVLTVSCDGGLCILTQATTS